jgi:hypothetical protein
MLNPFSELLTLASSEQARNFKLSGASGISGLSDSENVGFSAIGALVNPRSASATLLQPFLIRFK